MPLLVTLAELRPLVRSQGAVQRIRFIDDADLNPWCVDAWVQLYDIYARQGDPYFEKDKEITVADGVPTKIPTDLYRLRRVDFLEGGSGGRPTEIQDLDVHEVVAQAGTTSCFGLPLGFRLRSTELQLPSATPGQVYRVTYVPTPQEPRTADGTFLDTQPMDAVDVTGRTYIVYSAAARALLKQREDASGLLAAAGALERKIEGKAARRTVTRFKRVADTASWQFEDPYLSRRIPWRR